MTIFFAADTYRKFCFSINDIKQNPEPN